MVDVAGQHWNRWILIISLHHYLLEQVRWLNSYLDLQGNQFTVQEFLVGHVFPQYSNWSGHFIHLQTEQREGCKSRSTGSEILMTSHYVPPFLESVFPLLELWVLRHHSLSSFLQRSAFTINYIFKVTQVRHPTHVYLKASFTIMRSTYKRFLWRATRPVNTADCMDEGRYFLKYNRNVSILIHFKQYLPSFIQSAVFTGRVARQTNRLYVLRMIVKLAYSHCVQPLRIMKYN